MKSGTTYTRGDESRKVTGIQKVGNGKGKPAETGRVWWTHPPKEKEYHSTVAEFLAWMALSDGGH